MTTITESVFAHLTNSELVKYYNNLAEIPVSRFSDRKTALKRCVDIANVHAQKEEPKHWTGFDNCPHCGVGTDNGFGQHLQEVNGTPIKHEKYEYECLACGEEFGPEIKVRAVKSASVPTGILRPAMTASLKLDRRIAHLNEAGEVAAVYANACRIWKAGFITSAQCDRLSRELYTAAKRGEFITCTVSGNIFKLFVGAEG